MDQEPSSQFIKPTDLRGILNYVPRFLGQTFVVALDGAIIESDNLPNILLDIAVLRSLQIHIVIVHGVGRQLAALSAERKVAASSLDGSGPTDAATLDLAIRASSRVSHQILEALTKARLKCAITNSVRAKASGILKGEDQLHTGRTEQIDAPFLRHLITQSIIPIVQPIGFDRNGHTLRLNSDALAVDIGLALDATKILFLAPENGLSNKGELTKQIPAQQLEAQMETEAFSRLNASLKSKASEALRGVKKGIARVHLLDGRIHDGLIGEVFSGEGVGTLIYGNEYQQIRRAKRDEVPLVYHLTRSGVASEELVDRSMESIEAKIDRYHLYEIDGNIMGCVLLDRFPEDDTLREISSLFVHPLHQRQGIGRKLVRFACHLAKDQGARCVFALSTQSHDFFVGLLDFETATVDLLPPSRRHAYEANKRQSRVLAKKL